MSANFEVGKGYGPPFQVVLKHGQVGESLLVSSRMGISYQERGPPGRKRRCDLEPSGSVYWAFVFPAVKWDRVNDGLW